jgi:hypothetical protein
VVARHAKQVSAALSAPPQEPADSAGYFVAVTTTPGRTSLVCSSKGCRNPARYELRWNNPKLHPPERRKVWLTCEDHKERLSGFLQVRGFLRETVPMR